MRGIRGIGDEQEQTLPPPWLDSPRTGALALMRDAWHDEGFARRWDSQDVLRTNPDRAAQLSLLIALIAESYTPGDHLLDLGVGSGLVEEAIFERLPEIRVTGIDRSEAMLDRARARHGTRPNLRLLTGGFEALDSIGTLGPPFEFVICVQALHEVTHGVKQALFAFVRRHIAERGVFFVLDRFEYEPFALAPEFRCVWNRLNEHTPGTSLSFEEYRSRYMAKTDHTSTVERYLHWLREAGFHAACLYHHYNRALLTARPKTDLRDTD